MEVTQESVAATAAGRMAHEIAVILGDSATLDSAGIRKWCSLMMGVMTSWVVAGARGDVVAHRSERCWKEGAGRVDLLVCSAEALTTTRHCGVAMQAEMTNQVVVTGTTKMTLRLMIDGAPRHVSSRPRPWMLTVRVWSAQARERTRFPLQAQLLKAMAARERMAGWPATLFDCQQSLSDEASCSYCLWGWSAAVA